jgi:HEAT repeat protein
MLDSIVPDTTLTERQGVHYVALTASRMGIIWREIPNTDLGIDGYLEVIVHGAPIGLVAVQVKSGKSYIGKPEDDTHFTFRAETKHIRYWLSYRLPVIIIIYDPIKQGAYWRYIQDYFQEHDQAPNQAKKVPIPILKTACFDITAKERLVDIAASPDSTAHAMLALRASRYNRTRELLTSMEMLELYGKRGWLGQWIPLDNGREQILLHSTLARRGPGWYWFRIGSNRDYIPHLRVALEHSEFQVREEAALALAAAIGREAIPDLQDLLTRGDIFPAIKALATIPNLNLDDLQKIIDACWIKTQSMNEFWSRADMMLFLSIVAKFGGHQVQNQVVSEYCRIALPSSRLLLHNAGSLWTKQDLPHLRQLIVTQSPALQRLAVASLAEIGEVEDLASIIDHIETATWWADESNDLRWLANQIARLFGAEDLERLRQMSQSNYASQVVADSVLSVLCRRLDTTTLCQMINDPMPAFRAYAAEGLAETKQWDVLLEYEEALLRDLSYHEQYQEQPIQPANVSDSVSAIVQIVRALTATGRWEIIEELLKRESSHIRLAIAQGLRHVQSKQSETYLFQMLIDQDEDYIQARLQAGESLACIGDESTLQTIVGWLHQHLHESDTNLAVSVLSYLDQRLYCPIQWPLNTKRDFSLLRFSVTRDDYR